jgi:hypothetical protein
MQKMQKKIVEKKYSASTVGSYAHIEADYYFETLFFLSFRIVPFCFYSFFKYKRRADFKSRGLILKASTQRLP